MGAERTPTDDLRAVCESGLRHWPPFDSTRMLGPITAGADVMAIDRWCYPAWLAAKGLEPAAPGADNAADEFGRRPILGATLTGLGLPAPGAPNLYDDPVCLSMLDAGADPCVAMILQGNGSGTTPLSCAAGAGKSRMVARLLEDVRVRTRAHLTATSVNNSFTGTAEELARKNGYHETADLIAEAIAACDA
ncbi:unnamed protein product [Effrenium voratum]|nr:unnamed protein product [Effrenium voratum]